MKIDIPSLLLPFLVLLLTSLVSFSSNFSKMTQDNTESLVSFDTKYFEHLNSKINDNFVISPFSIITALSICGVGSDSQTLKQFLSLFGLKGDILSYYKQIINFNDKYNIKKNKFTISTFNKVYVHNKYVLDKKYKQLVKDMADVLPKDISSIVK